MRYYLAAMAVTTFAIAAAAPTAHASTLIADGITYSLTATTTSNPLTDQFTLTITGINGSSDTEDGRYGVESFALTLPSDFSSATAPAGFSEVVGGLNSGGCNTHGNFFCFEARPC